MVSHHTAKLSSSYLLVAALEENGPLNHNATNISTDEMFLTFKEFDLTNRAVSKRELRSYGTYEGLECWRVEAIREAIPQLRQGTSFVQFEICACSQLLLLWRHNKDRNPQKSLVSRNSSWHVVTSLDFSKPQARGIQGCAFTCICTCLA